MQWPTLGTWRYQRAAGLYVVDPARLSTRSAAAYIMLGRGGWGEIGDGAATFLIVATAAAGLGALTAMTHPETVLAPVTDVGLAALLLLEGALAGAVAPLLFLAGLRRVGATQTAVLSLAEPLAATLLAAMVLRQLPAPTQLLGAVLLVGAGIAVQVAPALSRAGLGWIAEAATAEMKVKSCHRTGSGLSTRCVAWATRRQPMQRSESCPIRFPWRRSRSSPTGTTSPATR